MHSQACKESSRLCGDDSLCENGCAQTRKESYCGLFSDAQSGFIALMLRGIELVKQQTTKGRSLRNDRPFGIWVPRRGLGHTGATPVRLACPTFLVLTSGAQAPDFLGGNGKSRPSCDDRPFGILVPRRGLEPPHPKAHGPEPCASTNSATWAYRCMLMVVPKAF